MFRYDGCTIGGLSKHLPQQRGKFKPGYFLHINAATLSPWRYWSAMRSCVCVFWGGFSGQSQQAQVSLSSAKREAMQFKKKPRMRPPLSCCTFQCKIGTCVCVNWHADSYSAFHSALTFEKKKKNTHTMRVWISQFESSHKIIRYACKAGRPRRNASKPNQSPATRQICLRFA